MADKLHSVIAVIGIDIGKNSFHVIGLSDPPPAKASASYWVDEIDYSRGIAKRDLSTRVRARTAPEIQALRRPGFRRL